MRGPQRLLISFVDISGYTQFAARTDDAAIAQLIDGYYERAAGFAERAGGRLVKPIGDGLLLVFPPERADDAFEALLALRDDVAAMCASAGWVGELVVRVHAGDVIAGPFGARDDKRFDVIGREVNHTARLPTRTVGLSAEAFGCLSLAGQTRFAEYRIR